MIEDAKRFSTGTYIAKRVAPLFQRMVRAERACRSASKDIAVVNGECAYVFRDKGECVCITCGSVHPWKGNTIHGGTLDTGHFIGSRRNSIVFEENNAHPQCKQCNLYLGGNQRHYETWMRRVYGDAEVERLQRLKNITKQFTRDELIDLKLEFTARVKAAEQRMT